MNSPKGQHDQDTETYRMPVHRRVARVRRSWWSVVAVSLLGVAGAVALIIVAGTGGATADVPAALQVGAQATPSTVATTPSTVATPSTGVTTPPTTLVPTTVAAPAGGGSTGVPTTGPKNTAPSTTTTVTTKTTPTPPLSSPLTIVIPKSKVTEGSDVSAGSDDGSRTTIKVGDN